MEVAITGEGIRQWEQRRGEREREREREIRPVWTRDQ